MESRHAPSECDRSQEEWQGHWPRPSCRIGRRLDYRAVPGDNIAQLHSAPFVNPPNSFVSHPTMAPFCPAAMTVRDAVVGFWNPFHWTAKRLLIPDAGESA